MGAYFILYPRARVLIWFPPIFLFHVPAWLMLGYWFVVNFLSGTTTAIAETHQTLAGSLSGHMSAASWQGWCSLTFLQNVRNAIVMDVVDSS